VAGSVDDTVVEVVVTWTGDSLGFCRPKMAAVVAAPTTADVPATMARVSFDMFAAGADMRESTSRRPADARFMSAVICLILSVIREVPDHMSPVAGHSTRCLKFWGGARAELCTTRSQSIVHQHDFTYSNSRNSRKSPIQHQAFTVHCPRRSSENIDT
jgi:hypothetical protein